MNKFKSVFLIILISCLLVGASMAQIIIKEKIELNTDASQSLTGVFVDTIFLGCHYYYYDSSKVTITFTPQFIEPGETAIMKLWVGQNEFNEDNIDIIQKSITIEPDSGSLLYLGNGEYQFTAPNEIPISDTGIILTVNYESYSQYCPGFKTYGDNFAKIIQDKSCIDCSQFGMPEGLYRANGTGAIYIGWDTLDVMIEPSQLFAGDTAQVIIRKRNPDGTFTSFDTTQTYEVGMLDGCLLGKIRAGGMDTNYIYG